MMHDDGLQVVLDSPATLAQKPQSLADYWADYIGSLDSSEVVPGGANLSSDTGDKFAELMMEKYRKSQ